MKRTWLQNIVYVLLLLAITGGNCYAKQPVKAKDVASPMAAYCTDEKIERFVRSAALASDIVCKKKGQALYSVNLTNVSLENKDTCYVEFSAMTKTFIGTERVDNTQLNRLYEQMTRTPSMVIDVYHVDRYKEETNRFNIRFKLDSDGEPVAGTIVPAR